VESIVKNDVDISIPKPTTDEADWGLSHMSIPATDSAEQFQSELYKYSNLIAASRNMHTHSATCAKYQRGKQSHCRFGFPQKLVESSSIDDDGILQLKRSNRNVNNWNPVMAATLRCNHDVSFIPTNTKGLALIYYITDYATKKEDPFHHTVSLAAAVRDGNDKYKEKQSEESKASQHFILRAVNKICKSSFQAQASECTGMTHYIFSCVT
jgi:hypothetical protein